MRQGYKFLFYLLLLAAVGCSRGDKELENFSPLTRGVLSGSLEEYSSIIENYCGKPDSRSSIYLLDTPERTALLSEYLLKSDCFDNVDASASRDSLPDFAGEKIVSILDFYLEDTYKDNMAYRDRLVLDALSAFNASDSVSSAKLVVASSCVDALSSQIDMDTLFGNSVIFPSSDILENLSSENINSIGIISTFPEAFKSLASSFNFNIVHSVSSTSVLLEETLRHFLSSYVEEGNTGKLERIIVDDFSIDIEEMHRQYLEILVSTDKEDENLKQLFSDNFSFVDMKEVASMEAYLYLRRAGLFTHEISYPTARAVVIPEDASSCISSCLDLSSVPSYYEGFLISSAPNTYISYVQNLGTSF